MTCCEDTGLIYYCFRHCNAHLNSGRPEQYLTPSEHRYSGNHALEVKLVLAPVHISVGLVQ